MEDGTGRRRTQPRSSQAAPWENGGHGVETAGRAAQGRACGRAEAGRGPRAGARRAPLASFREAGDRHGRPGEAREEVVETRCSGVWGAWVAATAALAPPAPTSADDDPTLLRDGKGA